MFSPCLESSSLVDFCCVLDQVQALSLCAPLSVATLFLTVSSNILQFLVVNHTLLCFSFCMYVSLLGMSFFFFLDVSPSKNKNSQYSSFRPPWPTHYRYWLLVICLSFFMNRQTYSHDNGRHADTMTFFSLYCDTLSACSTGIKGKGWFLFIYFSVSLGTWLIVLIIHWTNEWIA